MKKEKRSSQGVKKRTQRDYNIGFKLAVVSQVEKGEMTYRQAQNAYGIQGRSTVLKWLRKHGTLDWYNPQTAMGPKSKETPAQKIKRLERELSDERLKNEVLNMAIDISDSKHGTSIRKKVLPKQSGASEKKSKWVYHEAVGCLGSVDRRFIRQDNGQPIELKFLPKLNRSSKL